eukprot:4383289-Pleurochrysis_carterae.AAC.2
MDTSGEISIVENQIQGQRAGTAMRRETHAHRHVGFPLVDHLLLRRAKVVEEVQAVIAVKPAAPMPEYSVNSQQRERALKASRQRNRLTFSTTAGAQTAGNLHRHNPSSNYPKTSKHRDKSSARGATAYDAERRADTAS